VQDSPSTGTTTTGPCTRGRRPSILPRGAVRWRSRWGSRRRGVSVPLRGNGRISGFAYPRQGRPPFPDEMLGMIDAVDVLRPPAGPEGVGVRAGSKVVRRPRVVLSGATSTGTPVCPWSLVLESLPAAASVSPRGRAVGGGPGRRFRGERGLQHHCPIAAR